MRERRISARIVAPFPARFWGLNSEGQRFKDQAVLENLSSGGLYVRLKRNLPEGMHVSLAVRLSIEPAGEFPAVRLVARGTVLRVEPESPDSFGTAVEFNHRRVL